MHLTLFVHLCKFYKMNEPKLFMLLLGCRPPGRHTEQHDTLFAIGTSPKDLIPQILGFWPEVKGKIHVDAWREITQVDGYAITIVLNDKPEINNDKLPKLFFINLGGYKPNEFDEFHYKMLVVGNHKNDAVKQAKETAFYKHTGFKGAPSHIDDKYGIDVDDLHEIKDILPVSMKERYSILIKPTASIFKDEMHLGYFKLDKL